jgi:superfamily I DNA and/or RNA helicase
VIEFILQAIIKGEKILVCAPSNIAVDTILARLVMILENLERQGSSLLKSPNLNKLRNSMVRLGHPARVSTSILHYSLDYLISIDEVRKLCFLSFLCSFVILFNREPRL